MITIAEIAKLVGGTVVGDASLTIASAAPIRDAGPQCITIADDPRYESKLRQCEAPAVIVAPEFPAGDKTQVVVDDVHQAFSKLVNYLDPPVTDTFSGISPQASIATTAVIGEGCTIEPFAVIGENVTLGNNVHVGSGTVVETGCRVGDETRIFARCVLYRKSVIGDRCILHSGVVIGANGFGYQTEDGQHHLSAQLGNVIVGNDVEIGANSTVDRGTYTATCIGNGTKIDNLVMIAHNCQIGAHNLICSQVGIAGSSRTGDYVVLAGQVGIGDHIDIGTGATLAAKSGVMNHVPAKSVYVGIPATPLRDQMKTFAVINKLSQWYSKWKDMLRRIERIEQLLNSVPEAGAEKESRESEIRRRAA